MSNDDNLFPKVMKNIQNLIEDEEGNIPGNKLLMLGTMVIILGNMLAVDMFADHRSHSSHSSHRSHSSGSHGSHGNHGSHESHVSHQSHTSHANTASHSNSLYSAEADVIYPAPSVSEVPGVQGQTASVPENTFVLPEIEQNVELPIETPGFGMLPALGVPADSVSVKIDTCEVQEPSPTEKVR